MRYKALPLGRQLVYHESKGEDSMMRKGRMRYWLGSAWLVLLCCAVPGPQQAVRRRGAALKSQDYALAAAL